MLACCLENHLQVVKRAHTRYVMASLLSFAFGAFSGRILADAAIQVNITALTAMVERALNVEMRGDYD